MKLRNILVYLIFSLVLTHASYGQVTFGQSVPIVSALPATCTAVGSGSSSSSVQYQGTFYYCSATNTWTAYGSGGGGGTPGGSSGDYQINNAGAFGAGVLAQSSGRLTATPTAASSGVASFFRVITPADTTLTASTESVGAQFGGNTSAATVTRQWATGALTTQRENLFVAPTYAFAGASTLTTAATVAISGAPIAGTNATISFPLALWVQSGDSLFVPSGTSQSTIRIAHSDLTSRINLGVYGAAVTYAGGWFGSATPSNTNYAFIGNGSDALIFNVPDASGTIYFRSNHSNELMTIAQASGVGINKPSSIGAQLHTVSGSSSRVSGLFEGAASNSSALLVSKSGSSGTGDLWQGQNSSATVLAGFKSSGLPYFDATFTAGGTTGAQTINKVVGSVNFAASAASLVVTNSLVTTSSVVLCVVQTNDTTMKSCSAVPASGSFTLRPDVAPTGETKVAFVVINN